VGLVQELVGSDVDGRNYLADAFSLALDDFAERQGLEPTLADAAVVAGALGVMARLEPGDLDPVTLAGGDEAATARLVVARCAAYAPMLALKAPQLSPWIGALAKAGPGVDAMLGGDPATALDDEWLGKLAPKVFSFPVAREYLAGFLDRALALLAEGGAISGALVLCLRFRRWWRPSSRQRTLLRDAVNRSEHTHLRPQMDAALAKLDALREPS